MPQQPLPAFRCVIGSASKKRTILTAEKRTFYAVEGASCIVESGMQDALKRWVIAGTLATVADVDENRLTRLRQGLDLPDGRSKEAETQR